MTDTFDPFTGRSVSAMRAGLAAQRARGVPLVPTGVPDTTFVSRYDHVREVLLHHANFSSKDNFLLTEGDSASAPLLITQSDPPRHTALRDLLRPAFRRAAMTDAAPWIGEIVDQLLDDMPEGGPADIVGDLAQPLTAAVITRLIGVPIDDSERLVKLSDALVEMLPADIFATEQWAELEDYFVARAKERREGADRPNDVLTLLVTASVDGKPMTDREIAFHAWQLFVAGVESTANTIGWTVYHLLAVRDRWEALLTDRSLLPLTREEGLRHCTAIRWVVRTVTQDSEVSGANVVRGERMLVGLESANLDEAEFGANAAEFDMRRESAHRHVSFGYGIHHCLGAELSRIEITTTLERLLDRMPGLRLADDEAWHDLASPIFCGVKRVDVVW